MLELIDALELPEAVREDVRAVYGLIARAEGEAHGCEPGEVHFHEVGSLDAVADIAGASLLLRERHRAYEAQLSPDCRAACSACGAAALLEEGRCDG